MSFGTGRTHEYLFKQPSTQSVTTQQSDSVVSVTPPPPPAIVTGFASGYLLARVYDIRARLISNSRPFFMFIYPVSTTVDHALPFRNYRCTGLLSCVIDGDVLDTSASLMLISRSEFFRP